METKTWIRSDREHLVPWIPGEVVTGLALAERKIEVSWYVDA